MSSTIILTLIILIIGFALFISEIFPLPVSAMLVVLAYAATGIITFPNAFAGFSNDLTMLIIGAMIVGLAMAETGATTWLGVKVVKLVGDNEKKLLLVMMILSAAVSMFMANSGVMAMMMPLIAAVSAASNGKVKAKHLSLPIGIAVMIGGGSSLVGSTSQLVPQGILTDGGYRPFSMFELGLAGLPALIILIVYFMTFGYKILCKSTEKIPDPDYGEKAGSGLEDVKFTKQMGLVFAALIFMILGFIFKVFTNGAVAILAGSFCICTKCITAKKAFSKLGWGPVITIAACLGIAKALNNSGTAEYLADAMVGALGDKPSAFLILLAVGLFTLIIGNLMSHTPALTVLATVFIPLAVKLKMDPTLFAFALTSFNTLSFSTPLVASSFSMTLADGYSFKDYIINGIIPNVLCMIMVIAVTLIRMGIA
ncbi:MAG: SLC13/DASS family transporter [Oscillospiraceae bacterium]|nr:SLC13/DASS family transporter [Oscillospiraceae bacterium]